MPKDLTKEFKKYKEQYFPKFLDGEMSHAQIAKALKVSKRTVINWANQLREEEGIITKEVKDIPEEEDEDYSNPDEPFDMVLTQKRGVEEGLPAPEPKIVKKRSVQKEIEPTSQVKDAKIVLPRKEMMSALDRSYATMIKAYAGRQEWLSKVLEEVGMSTLFMTLQLAKIPPQEWYAKISEFKDPDTFTDFVNTYLVALFEAKEDAGRLIELEQENNILSAQVYYYEEQMNLMKAKLREMITYLNATTSMLTKEQMQKLFLWNALYKMQNEEVEGMTKPIKIEKKGDEEDE